MTPTHPPSPHRRVPFAPLEAAVARAGGLAHTVRSAAASPASMKDTWRLRRAWSRGRQSGYLTPRAADQLSVRLLKVTPWQVWPNWDRLDRYR